MKTLLILWLLILAAHLSGVLYLLRKNLYDKYIMQLNVSMIFVNVACLIIQSLLK